MLEIELAALHWDSEEEKAVQKNIVLAREYFSGEQHVKLSERQKDWIGFEENGRFSVNLCRMIVNALIERMFVSTFESVESSKSRWAWNIWEDSKMDSVQQEIYTGAVRDGEFFVFVNWDNENQKIQLIPHRRYTSPEVGGDGFGCKVVFEQNDPMLPIKYATKRWISAEYDEGGRLTKRRRLNVYFPDRIEKYILDKKASGEWGWKPYRNEDVVWPIPWIDSFGKPLGIPIVPFFNPEMRSELYDAIPIQDAINKCAVDILAAADATGFPLRTTQGFYFTTDGQAPDTDGGNYIELTPGAFIYIPEGKSIDDLEIPNLKPMLDVMDAWVMRLGQVTDTPLSRFQVTRQVRSEMTLRQEEAPLLARIQSRQTRFGNSWENVFQIAANVAREFGNSSISNATIDTLWQVTETKDELKEIEKIALKVERLHIPLIQAWQEAGYSEEEIASFLNSEEYQNRMRMMSIGFGPDRPVMENANANANESEEEEEVV